MKSNGKFFSINKVFVEQCGILNRFYEWKFSRQNTGPTHNISTSYILTTPTHCKHFEILVFTSPKVSYVSTTQMLIKYIKPTRNISRNLPAYTKSNCYYILLKKKKTKHFRTCRSFLRKLLYILSCKHHFKEFAYFLGYFSIGFGYFSMFKNI